jgi:hypothetical protein
VEVAEDKDHLVEIHLLVELFVEQVAAKILLTVLAAQLYMVMVVDQVVLVVLIKQVLAQVVFSASAAIMEQAVQVEVV